MLARHHIKKPLLSCNKGLNEEAKVVLHNKRTTFKKNANIMMETAPV